MSTLTLPAKQEERAVEFIPFGARDSIKLTASMVRSFISNPTKSGVLPDDRQCVRFVMLCKAKRLNPFEGDAYLLGYDGKNGPEFSLITAHQAFLKRAEANPEYDGMSSGVIVEAKLDAGIDEVEVRVIRRTSTAITYAREGDFVFADEKLVGGWAQVNFKDRSTPTLRRLNLSAYEKPFGLWAGAMKAGMIVKCAEADALRSSFPTLLGGMYIEGEMQPLQVEGEVLKPILMPQAIGARQPKAIAEPLAGDFAQYTTKEQEPAPAQRKPASKGKPAATTPDAQDAELDGLDVAQKADYRDRYNELLESGLTPDDAHAEALAIVRKAVEV